jgi:hypothetical protein
MSKVPQNTTKIVQDAVSAFESKCEQMSKKDYKIALEEVIASLEGNLDCVKDELAAEGGSDE